MNLLLDVANPIGIIAIALIPIIIVVLVIAVVTAFIVTTVRKNKKDNDAGENADDAAGKD